MKAVRIDSDGLITLQWSHVQGSGLLAPAKEGKPRWWVPCEECLEMIAVPAHIVGVRCPLCAAYTL